MGGKPSSVSIPDETVRKVAKLARLKLSESEVALYGEQLGRVLEYVAQLSAVDVDGVEPRVSPLEPVSNLRDDVAREGTAETRASLLDLAPEREDDAYRVPPIL